MYTIERSIYRFYYKNTNVRISEATIYFKATGPMYIYKCKKKDKKTKEARTKA